MAHPMLLLLSALVVHANVTLPVVLGEHMVLAARAACAHLGHRRFGVPSLWSSAARRAALRRMNSAAGVYTCVPSNQAARLN
jgi:hypothetical protein